MCPMAWLRRRALSLVFALIALGVVPGQTSPSARFAVLEPGIFHGQDVALLQPNDWVGVYCNRDGCEVRPTSVRVKRAADELVDDDPSHPTGTSVEVSSRVQPVFLVHGLPASAHRVETVFQGENSIAAGEEQQFSLKGRHYSLRITGKASEQEPLPKGSRLLLSDGVTTQELFSLPNGGTDAYVSVLWVGDIDGDGKPDFYINASDHYNVANKVLWLSSLGEKWQLVGRAAAFVTTGC